MTTDPLYVTVAGVPRSYQNPDPDGRWLTSRHVRQIAEVSPCIELTHATEDELTVCVLPPHPADVLLIEAAGARAHKNEISAANMAKLITPQLKWMQSCSSGIGHILKLELLADDVTLTNAAGVHSYSLAESIMAAILFRAKRLAERIENQRARNWQELHCSELAGQTLLIIGTGKIGVEAAKRARAFGMRVVGVRRTAALSEHFDDIYGPSHLKDALAEADFIVIACPLTPETERMIGAPEFAVMKPTAYLINIARGKITDEAALLDAITAGRISGAFLDALAEEPLPADHAFWSTPGITVIPHDSHSSPLIGDNIVDVFCENLRRYLAGEGLVNVVERGRGY